MSASACSPSKLGTSTIQKFTGATLLGLKLCGRGRLVKSAKPIYQLVRFCRVQIQLFKRERFGCDPPPSGAGRWGRPVSSAPWVVAALWTLAAGCN